jgi:hypothetical protein
LTSLWTSTPEKFPYVGPGSRKAGVSPSSGSPEAVANSMADALDQIAATPCREPRLSYSPSPRGSDDYPQNVSARSYNETPSPPHLPMLGRRLANSKARTPALSAMSSREVAQYLKTGEIPTRLSPQEANIGSEEMDWDLQYPISQHRAFKPAQPVQSYTQLFGQTPVVDNSTFWFKVPPAPVTPAHRLRNPPNQPRLRVSSKEVKENFFNNVNQRGSNENSAPVGKDTQQNDIEFAEPKFFPPPPTDSGSTLIGLLESFSLKDPDPEAPKTVQKSSRVRHAGQGLVLLLALFFWSQSFNRPSDCSRNIALMVMGACACIAARTILDNTINALPEKELALAYALGACTGGLELAAAGYGFLEVLAESGDPEFCASLGTILVGGMLVYETWFASFGR